MSFTTTETIQRLWDKFLREQMSAMPPEERKQYEQQFEDRFNDLLKNAANGSQDGFLDLVGFGGQGAVGFENLSYPYIQPDFNESVVPSQLHAAAELYFIYQHERMKVFQVVDVLLRLFQDGRMRIQRGPGARGLYLLEKWKPLRYTLRDRNTAYRRAFNYGSTQAPAGAIVNRTFHRQFLGFIVALAQYFRDLSISEVIRGGPLLNQRPFGSISTVQRIGLDLRYALDRATYGNIFALTMETGHYLSQVLKLLDAPDIKKAFDANTKWDVVEIVSSRYLGGVAEPSQRARMAESGRRIIQFISDSDFKTAGDPILFQSELRPIGPHAEAWLAAYRMIPEGRSFAGGTSTLKSVIGVQSARV
ncbi:hypothetical protein [Candidatus Cyanaurora vandensis]|uniref:hypothetical protein n=1 Tax=Candidatus Cyanaurora vandensis TaxID=2714958 RepID=UPI0025801957|nr:hypothetical protein [Candidatus Cyanaurora vandensis]